MLQNKTNKRIYLRADARSQYGKVEDAIDSVRTAGVDQIGLLTEKKQTP
jgi:biopolymer transport protein ExbD/biopolymer transport protein TolR